MKRIKFIFCLTIVIGYTQVQGQVQTKKIKEPCDCISAIIDHSDDLIMKLKKEDSTFMKQYHVDHFFVDFDLIVNYCEDQFEMSSQEVEKCKDFEKFESNRKEINEIKKQIQEESRAAISANLDMNAMAMEFCACTEYEAEDEVNACLEDFEREYGNLKPSKEQVELFNKIVEENCSADKINPQEQSKKNKDIEITKEMRDEVKYTDFNTLTSSCECVHQVGKSAEKVVAEFEKTKDQDLLKDFQVELEVVGEYCEDKFEMDSDLESCSDYENAFSSIEKYMDLVSSIEEDNIESEEVEGEKEE